MAVAEIRVQTEEEVVQQLERIAARQNRSAADLLRGIAEALARGDWQKIPIHPEVERARGIAGPLPDRPDRELIEDALSDD
jgi:hypothetical protein